MADINEEITTRTQWREAVKLYRSSATIHGISRIGEPHLYSCRPITWVFLTLTMASVLLAMLFLQFTKYAAYPTLTKIDAVFNKKLDFPAVTVCNLNMFHRSIMNCTGPENADKMYTFFKTLSNVGVLHGILNISKESVTTLSGEELKQCALEYSYKRSTLIVQCVWEGTIQNCSDIFESTTTRYGICFTFNKNSDSLRFTESYGSDSGLHILINLNQDEYFFSRSLQAGVKIILHEPEENPRPMSRGIYVGPGMSAAIAIQKEKMKALPYPYKAFGSELCFDMQSDTYVNPLVRYVYYSRPSCLSECDINELVRRCNCQFFLHPGNDRLCNGSETIHCFLKELHNTAISKDYRKNCTCGNPCLETNYKAEVSYSKFGSDFINDVLYKDGILPDVESVSKNFIDVTLYYSSLVVTETVQVPEMSIGLILGSFGGLMGLFLGASLLSVTELVELVIMLVTTWMKHKRKHTNNNGTENTNGMHKLNAV